MSEKREPGSIIAAHYKVVTAIGSGFASTVYKVIDTNSQKVYALKLFKRDFLFPEYTDHLLELQVSLSGIDTANLLVPLDSGYENGELWQIFPFIESPNEDIHARLLREGVIAPGFTLSIISKVATVLGRLHMRELIHGDIKPQNILLSGSDEQPHLIDFGMVQKVSREDTLLIVGTYSYLHPLVRSIVTKSSETTQTIKSIRGGKVGPYIDIYALGIVCLQMLTGQLAPPQPLTEHHLIALMIQKNPLIREGDAASVDLLAKLILKMLQVKPGDDVDLLEEISGIAESLAQVFPHTKHSTGKQAVPMTEENVLPSTTYAENLDGIIREIRSVASHISEASAVMLKTSQELKKAASSEGEAPILSQVDLAFRSAAARIRNSWRTSLVMTAIVFVLIVAMVITAVTLGVIQGTPGWSIVFGGLSVSAVIGTLIWRPYDRAFKATILAQQLELIHIQTMTAFQSTDDLDKRIAVCQEAIISLQTLLEK